MIQRLDHRVQVAPLYGYNDRKHVLLATKEMDAVAFTLSMLPNCCCDVAAALRASVPTPPR